MVIIIEWLFFIIPITLNIRISCGSKHQIHHLRKVLLLEIRVDDITYRERGLSLLSGMRRLHQSAAQCHREQYSTGGRTLEVLFHKDGGVAPRRKNLSHNKQQTTNNPDCIPQNQFLFSVLHITFYLRQSWAFKNWPQWEPPGAPAVLFSGQGLSAYIHFLTLTQINILSSSKLAGISCNCRRMYDHPQKI